MLQPLEVRGKLFKWDDGPFFMGILNITPDSFSDGGKYLQIDQALAQAENLIREGADIIDIGGESSRPFAEPVTEEEEIKRVIPVIREIRKQYPEIIISVDTYKSRVAELALKEGADIINDISALRFDGRMIEVIKTFRCPVIIMHMQGTPKTMQIAPKYQNIVEEVKEFLKDRLNYLRSQGIPKDRIIIDPGIGFGKTFEHNLALLKNLTDFKDLEAPILVGTSRKSFIGEIVKRPAEKRDGGTVGTTVWAYLKGVNILRVHRVDINRDALKVFKALERGMLC